MQRRIFGIETEYGVTCTFKGQRRLSPDEVARYLFRRVVSWGRSSNVFLRNGSRLYLDVGSHPEYATAECVRLVDVLAQDRAGDRMLVSLARRAEQTLADEGTPAEVRVFKNNVDGHGNSWGTHENHQLPRSLDLPALAVALSGFLIARPLLCGAGRLVAEGGWRLLNIPAQCEDPATDPLGRPADEFMVSARGRTQQQWELRKAAAGGRAQDTELHG